MNRTHIPLPEIYKSYIKDDIQSIIAEAEKKYTILGPKSTHSILRVPSFLILTQAGLKRFREYWPMIDIFRLSPNSSSLLHIDNSFHAFNFVITNNGYMEWFDVEKLEHDVEAMVSHPEGNTKYKYPFDGVIDTTDSTMMWVNTKIPHRVVNNTPEDRICVSIRTIKDIPFFI